MPDVTTISQVAQWGKEATPGTGVAATVAFDTFAVMDGIESDARELRPQGYKAPSLSQLTREWTGFDVSGWPSYTADVYLLSQLLGAATIGSVGNASKEWLFTDDGVTETSPVTFTMERGSAVRAAKWNYGCLTDYGLKWKRSDVTIGGKGVGQKFQDAITLTSSGSIARVASTPVGPGDLNVYIDPASGSLGSTQYTQVFDVDFGLSGKFKPKWPANRANTSWEKLVEVPAKWALKLKAMADTQGVGNPLGWLRAGTTVFVRLEFMGALIPGESSFNYLYQIDLACQVGQPEKYEDIDGVWALGWDLIGIRDATWGFISKVKLRNKLAAL
jgi:hypothetical protein